MGNQQQQQTPPFSNIIFDDEILVLPDGRNLAYRICGAEPGVGVTYVLAFHGALGTGDFDVWESTFRELNWRVIAPTLPGWGRSTPHTGRTLRHWAEDVSILSDQLNIHDSYVVVGISYGCVHALSCAVYNQSRVKAIALLGPHAPFDDPTFNPLQGMALPSRMGLGSIAYYAPFITSISAKYIQSSLETQIGAQQFKNTMILSKLSPIENQQLDESPHELQVRFRSAETQQRSMEQSVVGFEEIPFVLRSWSYRDLSLISCPTYIYVGRDDNTTPIHGAEYLRQHIHNSILTVLDGGHMS